MIDMTTESFQFDFIGLSEVFECSRDIRLSLPDYHDIITQTRDDDSRGGVAFFVRDDINFKVRDDLSVMIPHVYESIFI